MPEVSSFMAPLSGMSSQKYFNWTALHEKCFRSIKDLACKSPVLKPIDPIAAIENNEEIFLVCDTSVSGIGAYYGQGKDWLTC